MSENAISKVKAHFSWLIKNRSKSNVIANFHNVFLALHRDGALSKKYKELICLAISVYAGCIDCILIHLWSALKLNATREEIMEACTCALAMGGGIASPYLRYIDKLIEEFEKERMDLAKND